MYQIVKLEDGMFSTLLTNKAGETKEITLNQRDTISALLFVGVDEEELVSVFAELGSERFALACVETGYWILVNEGMATIGDQMQMEELLEASGFNGEEIAELIENVQCSSRRAA